MARRIRFAHIPEVEDDEVRQELQALLQELYALCGLLELQLQLRPNQLNDTQDEKKMIQDLSPAHEQPRWKRLDNPLKYDEQKQAVANAKARGDTKIAKGTKGEVAKIKDELPD